MSDCVKYEIHDEVAGLPKSWKGAFNMTYGGGQGDAGLFEVC